MLSSPSVEETYRVGILAPNSGAVNPPNRRVSCAKVASDAVTFNSSPKKVNSPSISNEPVSFNEDVISLKNKGVKKRKPR